MSIAPYDYRKPLIPYAIDWTFHAQQHIAPPPPELSYRGCVNTPEQHTHLRQLHPIEQCLENPPLEGSYGPTRIELCVRDTIRVDDKHNAQLAVVEVLAAEPPVGGLVQGTHVVAKLYDPLYVDDEGLTMNPFMISDQAYTCEVATYNVLPDLQGAKIPRYFGSDSLDIPVELPDGIPATRSVRLILIECILGSCMRDIDPDEIPQPARQNIMRSIIEFETLVYSRHAHLRDLHPRNIMLTKTGDIVFVDFGDTWFASTNTFTAKKFQWLSSKWVSPILRWHEARTRMFREHDFYAWIDWDWQPWLETEFQHTAASITPEMQKRFLSARLLERYYRTQ